jgi:hypothetical protein
MKAGDWVEVRSREEILSTLDENAQLEGLPLMPQMLQYCGQRFKIYKRAHKTCDTVSGCYSGRRLRNGIHLDHRCNGQAYGGCQAACLIFWKDAWLKPIDPEAVSKAGAAEPAAQVSQRNTPSCTEEDVFRGTRVAAEGSEDRYVCQATQLLDFTQPLKWWDARQYIEDYASGNVSLNRMLCVFTYFGFYYGTLAYRGRLGIPARWLYDTVQSVWGGIPFPRHRGKLKSGKNAPTCNLNLAPGDLVRVKSYKDILLTLNSSNLNRGLCFDAELVPYCGKTYRVRTRVQRFIDESTGKMKKLKTPAVILERVYCQSRFSGNRLFCPRSIFAWWREIWLERVAESDTASQNATSE